MAESAARPRLWLTVGTPQALLRDRVPIAALQAADASGSFGIHPGHEALLTVLVPGVLRWQEAGGAVCWCAVDDAVLRVHGGDQIEIAAQEAIEGADRSALEALVLQRRQQEVEARRAARSDDTRLQTQAMRKLAAWLVADARGGPGR